MTRSVTEVLEGECHGDACLRVHAAFREQADLCDAFGSGFTARVLRGIERVLTPETRFGARVLNWPGDPAATADALPLRVAGALHALARSNRDPVLAGLYPPHPAPEPDALERALAQAIGAHDAALETWLDHAPQTNEVGRSALLYAGMIVVADRTGLPLSIFEIGASAGLNLILDRYAYELGSWSCGDLRSPLVLMPDWTGPVSHGPMPRIVARRGCDLAPIDVTQSADAARLTAYVWPDQVDRHRRLALAIRLLRRDRPAIDRMDAYDWVRRRIGVSAEPAVARVLFHSLTFSYLPEAGRLAITAQMEAISRTAPVESPLAWLAFELDGAVQPRLTLRLWPGGDKETLAEADPHGCRIHWLSEGR